MKNKKILLVSVLLVALAVILTPMMQNNVFAESTVAKIGDTEYTTLQEAINVGGEVTLFSDVKESITISEETTVTLNLNGYKITNTDGNDTITNNGTLTINGEGTVDNVSHAKATILNTKGATCTLNGGTYDRSEEKGSDPYTSGGNSYYTINNTGGTMIINEGVTVTTASGNSNYGKYSSLVINLGMLEDGVSTEATMIINGGTFTGGINTIKNDGLAILEINDGTFSGAEQDSIKTTYTATINGGTFENTICMQSYSAVWSKGILTINGGNFNTNEYVLMGYSDASNPATVTITGGTFNSQSGLIDESLTYNSVFEADKTVVSGGTFAVEVDEKYISDDKVSLQKADGTYIVCSLDDPADYTEVDVAIEEANSIDKSLYLKSSLQALEDALNAVVRDKKITEQAVVDNYAEAINNALDNLEPAQTGDMNTDGFVNSTDAALVLDCYKNGNSTSANYTLGDMNSDNILNSTDAAMILDIYKNS